MNQVSHDRWKTTYSLDKSVLLTGAGDGALAVLVNQLRHCCRTYKQGKTAVDGLNRGASVDLADISHYTGTEPYAIKSRFVRITRDEICSCTRIEGPGLLVCSLGCYQFKVVSIDDRVQWRLLVVQHDPCILRGRLLQPLVVDGGFIQDSLELVRLQVLPNYRRRMYLVICLCSITPSVLQDD